LKKRTLRIACAAPCIRAYDSGQDWRWIVAETGLSARIDQINTAADSAIGPQLPTLPMSLHQRCMNGRYGASFATPLEEVSSFCCFSSGDPSCSTQDRFDVRYEVSLPPTAPKRISLGLWVLRAQGFRPVHVLSCREQSANAVFRTGSNLNRTWIEQLRV